MRDAQGQHLPATAAAASSSRTTPPTASTRPSSPRPTATAALKPILRPYDTIGSTRYVDFDTTQPVYRHPRRQVPHLPRRRRHRLLGAEAGADARRHGRGRPLRQEPQPRLHDPLHARTARSSNYIPDFIACIDDGHGRDDLLNLIVEVTGEKKKDKAAKVATARTLWVPAVNNHGGFGRWAFVEIADPWDAQELDPRPFCDDAQRRADGGSGCMAKKTRNRSRPTKVESHPPQGQAHQHPHRGAARLRRRRRARAEDDALPARPVARPAARLEGQGRAGPRKTSPCPSVPIYIQEKIHPQAIIEDLRAERRSGEPEPAADLFADFNGLDDFDKKVDFYHHDQHWSNRMILGDSLLVMTSLAEKEGLKGKVQMIYIDPPYGIKFGSNWQVSTRKRDVKDGKAEDADAPARTDPGVPRHLGARHPLLPGLPARPARRRPRAADRDAAASSSRSATRMCIWCDACWTRCLEARTSSALIAFAKTTAHDRRVSAWQRRDYLLWYAKDRRRSEVPTALSREELGDAGAAVRPARAGRRSASA